MTSMAVHCHPSGKGSRDCRGSFASTASRLYVSVAFSSVALRYDCGGGGEVQSAWRVATRGEICARTRSRVRGKAGTLMQQRGSGVCPLTTERGPPPTREISPIRRRAGRICQILRMIGLITPACYHHLPFPSYGTPSSYALPSHLPPRWILVGQPWTGLEPCSLVDVSIDMPMKSPREGRANR